MTARMNVESGEALTLRDENGGLWRVAGDNLDRTLAVEEIYDGTDQPETAETVGLTPCAVARWNRDLTWTIMRVSHGENHTDATTYQNGHELLVAGSAGWEQEQLTP